MDEARVLVIGGGITGLAAAEALLDNGISTVVVREAAAAPGGCLRTSPFAGLSGVDEGPDAFLLRQPAALELARRIGLADALVSPTDAHAAVWYPNGRGRSLHSIPNGVLLGVPADLRGLLHSALFGLGDKVRAATDLVRPRTSSASDSLGAFVRSRLGDAVHDRLVDALVGSIYATDTDALSLASVPQLATIATSSRSLILGAHRQRRQATTSGPIFAGVRSGLGTLIETLADRIMHAGGQLHTGVAVQALEADGHTWRIDGDRFDEVVIATPAAVTARLLRTVTAPAADLLAATETADVIMVTIAIDGDRFPERLRGRSGYLVPKSVQGYVTAASFGSQKWAHWRPADGREILRISLGRDGRAVRELDDARALSIAIDEVGRHLGIDLQPNEVRITRWLGAFPQYRPHHGQRIASIEAHLPDGVHLAGASYHGIGIPACVASAQRAAAAVVRRVAARADR